MRNLFIIVSLLFFTATLFIRLSYADNIILTFKRAFKFKGKFSKELVENLIAKNGDEFVVASKKFCTNVVKRNHNYGDDSLNSLSKYVNPAIKALQNYGDDALRFVHFGDYDAIDLMAKYKNINKQFFENYCKELIVLNKKLPREKFIAILDSAELAETGIMSSKILNNGNQIISFIEKHPKLFIGVPLVASIYKVITNEELYKELQVSLLPCLH